MEVKPALPVLQPSASVPPALSEIKALLSRGTWQSGRCKSQDKAAVEGGRWAVSLPCGVGLQRPNRMQWNYTVQGPNLHKGEKDKLSRS